jgi:homoserine O-acetyltransferase/O-succinyltransferase
MREKRFMFRAKQRISLFVTFTAIVLCRGIPHGMAQSSQTADHVSSSLVSLNEHQNDASFENYRFHDGKTVPQLQLHYVTLGHPHKNADGVVDNAILLLHWTNASSQSLLVPEYENALFVPGAPLDATRFFVIIPDDVGHGKSSKPSDGLKAAFPHYGYSDIVDLQHKLVMETLGVTHLHAVVGMSMGCMNAWQWAESYPDAMDGVMPIACFPAPISGRNLLWRTILIDSIKTDPTGSTAFAIARMMIDGVPALQQEVRSPEAADALMQGIKSQAGGQDANNVIYSFESSRDFNAEPALGQIKAKVFALNFTDDEFYRDSLQILERDIQQVHRAQVVIRPISVGSVGHFTMSHPDLWKDQVQAFMKWLDTN